MNCLDCNHDVEIHNLNGCNYFGFGLPRCNCKHSPGEVTTALVWNAWKQAHDYYCINGILCVEHAPEDVELFMEDNNA